MGIDLSTQSCTIEVRDAETFAVVGSARASLPPTSPPLSEQRTEDWWGAFCEALNALSTKTDLQQVGAISVSGQCHGLVALDELGETIRPVKLWNDTTTAEALERLFEKVSEEEWLERTGSVPSAAFTIAKLAWLIENEPENVSRIRKIILPHDYLTWRLTGQFVTDRSEASGTGYFDSVNNVYLHDMLRKSFGDVLAWKEVFPRVGQPGDVAGHVQEAAASLGLPVGIPVAVGGGDQHVAALGLGIGTGDVVFSLGTSGVVITSSTTPVIDRTGMVDGVANVVGGWLPLVCTLNSTKVTDWAARILGVNIQELDELAMRANLKNTPIFAAYLDGERSPVYPSAMGAMSHLTGNVGREEIAASCYYGVLLGLLRGMDSLVNSGVPTDGRIMAIGGGAGSTAYTQFLADLLCREVSVIREPEATARGACLQALALLKRQAIPELAAQFAPEIRRTVNPRVDRALWPEIRSEYLETATFAASTVRG